MDEFDHFVKEVLHVKRYLRYTDDFLFLHHNPIALVSLLPRVRAFFRERLALELHPKKVILRKASQGLDFLGFVTLPHHRVLRTKTKRRMLKQLLIRDGRGQARLQSYLGLLGHCHSHRLTRQIDETFSISDLMPIPVGERF